MLQSPPPKDKWLINCVLLNTKWAVYSWLELNTVLGNIDMVRQSKLLVSFLFCFNFETFEVEKNIIGLFLKSFKVVFEQINTISIFFYDIQVISQVTVKITNLRRACNTYLSISNSTQVFIKEYKAFECEWKTFSLPDMTRTNNLKQDDTNILN